MTPNEASDLSLEDLDKKVIEVLAINQPWRPEKAFKYMAAYKPHANIQLIFQIAQDTGLFEAGYALARVKGVYTGTWAWHVGKLNRGGIIQGFVYGNTPALAIARAIAAAPELLTPIEDRKKRGEA